MCVDRAILVELRNEYLLKSNRESGYGRYDVMLIPKEKNPIIIEEKQYDTELLMMGFSKENIKHES